MNTTSLLIGFAIGVLLVQLVSLLIVLVCIRRAKPEPPVRRGWFVVPRVDVSDAEFEQALNAWMAEFEADHPEDGGAAARGAAQ